jgi:uncharacterized protein
MNLARMAATVLALAAAPALASAQPAPPAQPAQPAPPAPSQPEPVQPGPAETLLHLSATASVQTAPDQLVAELVAHDTASSAADAQRRVNVLIAQGLQAARQVAAVDARAIGYQVYPADEHRTRWVAQQTLELRGADGSALLDLANRLQQQGFVTAALDWQLSSTLRRRTHAEATTAALRSLQQQAASAAATLGLRVDHLKDVQLQPQDFRPARPMMAVAARAAAPAPQATAAPEAVTAQVSAEVILRP